MNYFAQAKDWVQGKSKPQSTVSKRQVLDGLERVVDQISTLKKELGPLAPDSEVPQHKLEPIHNTLEGISATQTPVEAKPPDIAAVQQGGGRRRPTKRRGRSRQKKVTRHRRRKKATKRRRVKAWDGSSRKGYCFLGRP